MNYGEQMLKAMESRDGIEPPRGKYNVEVVEASAFTYQKDGEEREAAATVLKITDGELAGENFRHFMGLSHPVGKEISANTLAAYGINWTAIPSFDDLKVAMNALVGRTAEVTVSYKDGYMNVAVHGSRNAPGTPDKDIPSDMEKPEKPAASFASAAGSDESVPF